MCLIWFQVWRIRNLTTHADSPIKEFSKQLRMLPLEANKNCWVHSNISKPHATRWIRPRAGVKVNLAWTSNATAMVLRTAHGRFFKAFIYRSESVSDFLQSLEWLAEEANRFPEMHIESDHFLLECRWTGKLVVDPNICRLLHQLRDLRRVFSSYSYVASNANQIAYSLIEEQEGKERIPDAYISFVSLLADPRYCGKSYLEKEEVRVLLRQDPGFWACRPMTDLMIRAAADDVRFLLYIHSRMMEKLTEKSLWHLAVRGSLYCQCFCITENEHADWPSPPPFPESFQLEGYVPEEEILSVLSVPPGKMGRVIGKRGSFITSVKKWCNAEILIGGEKGPPDMVFIIGPVKQVRKAEAILRGCMHG